MIDGFYIRVMQAVRRFAFPSQTLPSSSKTVFNEIPNATRKSNIWWRGRSFAASVPSESSKTQKGQKKTSIEERRALIKAFIESYKASNGGKYPTPSAAQKQVGGSYYVVKKILQEIEYQSKVLSTSKSSVNPVEKDGIHSSLIGAISHETKSETKEILHPYVEESKETNKVEAHFENSIDLNHLDMEDVQKVGHGISKSDEFERDIHGENEGQMKKRLNVWGNLRSLTDNFLSLWRK